IFMSTGIESWTPVKEVAALSPFSGSEVLLTIIAVVLWIVFHIWQLKSENNAYDEQVSKLQ
ncbi:MAG: hypothetical protein VYA81_06450, partial [SAR324 cluster bacterium]|nr:hypothetical protein [SAR324 cluster bacterium]